MRAYVKGDRVSQPQYGTGTITEVNDRHTIIDFDEHGLRTFSTPIVKLERTTTAAPVVTKRATRKRTSSAAGKAS
jgi:hypothetical protein